MNDHDLLIRIDEHLQSMDDCIDRMEKTLEKGEVRFKDHDDEIKEIRTWKNKVTGAITIIGVLMTGLIVFMIKMMGGKA